MPETVYDASGTVGGADAFRRKPMGIELLDRLLHGGLPEGNSLLVQGAPGTGKTILGMQFIYAGIALGGQPGLMVTFEEHPRRLYRDARALGWDFEALERERKLLIVFTSPEAFLRELAADQYGRMICDYGFQRVVVDSLTQFESYPSAEEKARVRFERVVNALRQDDLTVLMTRETETREAPFRVTPEEYLADTIIQLEYRRLDDSRDRRRIRLLEVLKNRGSGHSSSPYLFEIAEGGLHLQSLPSTE
ncbi:MAG: AAA family ATPase [Armatimonadota bacterium]|nr:AAA family ATPase [Armatimonadota bacterium]